VENVLASSSSEWTATIGFAPSSERLPVSLPWSQVMWTVLSGATARRAWKVSSPAMRVGGASVFPPSVEVDSHRFLGLLPWPVRLT
jgi:hypothetical protein